MVMVILWEIASSIKDKLIGSKHNTGIFLLYSRTAIASSREDVAK